jgi:hypothetical protein
MDKLEQFLAESPIAEKVALPTQVILNRLSMSPGEAASVIDGGSFSPSGLALREKGEETCELEAGGQCIARGRIVHRRGGIYFKVIEMGEGGSL